MVEQDDCNRSLQLSVRLVASRARMWWQCRHSNTVGMTTMHGIVEAP